MRSLPARLSQVFWVAAHAWRMASRQRVFLAMALVCLGLVVLGAWLRDFHFGVAADRFVLDFGLGCLALFGPCLTIVAVAQVFFGEIESGSAATVLARAITRTDYLIGLWLGVMAVLAVFCAVAAMLVGVLVISGTDTPNWRTIAPLIGWGGLLQWAKCAWLGAATLVLASYSQKLSLTVLLAIPLWMAGLLRSLVLDLQRTDDLTFGAQSIRAALQLVPDFERFASIGSSADALGILAYAGCYIIGCLAIASLSFSRRDV